MSTKYQRLKGQITKLGLVIPGTLRTVHLRCGRKGCRCRETSDKAQWHGPYTFWDRKVGGKLSSMSIAADEVKTYQEWIKNRKKMEKLVAQMLDFGLRRASKRNR